MKRALTWINLAGAFALAFLCVVQWQRDRRLNLEINRLKKEHYDQQERISRQDKLAADLKADLERFKEQVTQTHAEAGEARTAMRKLERENSLIERERDQLKTAVTNWSRAVAERDQSLRESNDRLRDTAARLNDSIVKYNELTTNYNASIRRFQELATNYNNVVTQLNASRSGENKSR